MAAVGVLVVLVVAALVPAAGSGVSASSTQQVDDNEPSSVNFTVTWSRSPRMPERFDPQSPGAFYPNVTATARGFPVNLTPLGNITVGTPEGQRSSSCVDSNHRDTDYTLGHRFETFQIAQNETSFITLKDDINHIGLYRQEDGTNIFWFNILREGRSTGTMDGPPPKNNVWNISTITVKLEECVAHPEQPGWYRWYGHINGSNDGRPSALGADDDDQREDDTADWRTDNWWGDDSEDAGAAYSHWYYVCNCSDRQDAEQTLGLPPHYYPHHNASMRAPNYNRGVNLTLYAPGSKDRLPPPNLTNTATPTPSPTPTPTSTPTASPAPPPTSEDSPGLRIGTAVSGMILVVFVRYYRS